MATGASLTGLTVIDTVAVLRVDRAVVGLEGEAVGAVVVGGRGVGQIRRGAAEGAVRGIGDDRVGERIAVGIGGRQGDRLGRVFVGR